MAKLNYQNIPEKDLGGGIDQQSSENKILPGYCEDIENADPQPTGQISKRKGYQGYSGNLPVRVVSVEYVSTTEQMCFTLDSNVELPNNNSTPLIIVGKTSDAISEIGGDLSTTESINYYSEFSSNNKFVFDANTFDAVTEGVGLTATSAFVGVAESTSEANNNNSRIYPEEITLDTADLNVNVVYNNSSDSLVRTFIYINNKDGTEGDSYISSPPTQVFAMSSETIVISKATHELSTDSNILVQCYDVSGPDKEQIKPDSVTINPLTGDVTVVVDNRSAEEANVEVVLSRTPIDNVATGSVSANSNVSITFSTDVPGGTDFIFAGCYLKSSPSSYELVEAESVMVDSVAKTATVTFNNKSDVGYNFNIIWEYAQITNNVICVTSDVDISSGGLDTNPQISIYGLDHSDIYGNKSGREGWTHHIDSYRADEQNRIIAGLGGNFYASRLSSESGIASTYLMPTVYPDLFEAITGTDIIMGPAFYDTGETPGRTRGFITGDNMGNNLAEVTSIAYNSGTGYVDYTLEIPNMLITGTLSDIISSDTSLPDIVTFSQCGSSIHNGEFTVKSIASPTSTSIVISVNNQIVSTSDYDEVDVGGYAGVFTDRITSAADSKFVVGDIISSSLISDNSNISVTSVSSDTFVLNNITEIISLPANIEIIGTRTSSVVPLRDIDGNADVTNLVAGDMLTYTGIDRQLRINSINALPDTSLTITGDGETATATLATGDTESFKLGKKYLLTNSTNYGGVIEVLDIPTTTKFTFASTSTASESANLKGLTIELDEELTFTDNLESNNKFTVHSRWIPVEHPEDSFNLTPQTRTFYADSNSYTSQPITRSATVQDNLYLTNQDDEVFKFDGVDIYRAGLFRWQPQAFLTVDTAPGGQIDIEEKSPTYDTADSNGRFEFTTTPEDALNFSAGQEITDSNTPNKTLIVEDVRLITDSSGNASKGIVYVIGGVGGGGSGTLSLISKFRYYFRLNAVDANDNIVASAVTGSNDYNIKLGEDAAVRIKLTGFPAFDIYDYDKLEVQIYRTKANQIAPFFLLTTLKMSFNSDDGYIEYVDSNSDEDLFTFDNVNTSLKGAELGTQFEQPLRAKYCTSAGNRLILGNLKGYQELDIRLLGDAAKLTQANFTANSLWQFRKDNTDAGTGTDMINRARYQFIDVSGALTISGIATVDAGQFRVTTSTPHGIGAGDWVYLFHSATSGTRKLKYAGWWQVADSPGGAAATFDINLSDDADYDDLPDSLLVATAKSDIPVPIGTDGNFDMLNFNPPTTLSYTSVAINRLAMAINASMRKVDTSLFAYKDFSPWMVANAGGEFASGQLLITQPKVFPTFMEVTLPALDGAFSVFVNDRDVESAKSASAKVERFPSRVIASYPNFPEIFDNPTATLDTDSPSAIDINPADGQEITAIIPFFGDSAFGAAQKSGIVVVFKTNSIYLIDLAAKARGENPVQRLETRGKGCTAPNSVAVSRGGIIFANETGIYKLGRDLKVEYVGRKYERKFLDEVSRDNLAIATGHHDSVDNQYKMSYPVTGEDFNSKVAVYNHTREYEGQGGEGSWTTYDNHPSTGWCNLQADSFFATDAGRVFIIRRLGEASDYRDDSSAINMTILTRAMDMGDSSIRKVIKKITTHYRTLFGSDGTTLEAALDLKNVFQDTDAFRIVNQDSNTGISGNTEYKVQTIESVIDEKICVYLQLRYKNSVIDEAVEIAGIDIRVASKGDAAIQQAASTTS